MDRIAGRYGVQAGRKQTAALLFAVQTYYAAVVELVVERFASRAAGELLPEGPFAWWNSTDDRTLRLSLDRLRDEVARLGLDNSIHGPCDWFRPLYQELFPRRLRRRLGEFYTPDWLVEHVLDQVGYSGGPTATLLDPACGSGAFLMAALRRLKASLMPGNDDSPSSLRESKRFAIDRVVGFDLNPLAVLTARANYLLAVADLLPADERFEMPIYLHNSILDEGARPSGIGPFDFVVGNPPWIAWDNLPERERRLTKPLWRRYGLFSLSGNEARHGGGKKDLAMLMLYAAADRYLKTGGRLGMVVTQTVFQTIGAGDGFRRFRIGDKGRRLGVLRVDDLTAVRPFDAAARTATIVLRKGVATRYPVQYVRWTADGQTAGNRGGGQDAPPERPTNSERCSARPIDPARPTSPWLVTGDGDIPARSLPGAAYVARLGANTGGANGVYWLEVLGRRGDDLLVRNLAAAGKHAVECVEALVEADLLYPLLRWGDVARYRAMPRHNILLAQDPATRSGIDELTMRSRYPRALAYLERFKKLLLNRAAYRRYQQRAPFYSMYNVGPYTVAPIKVVWRRMDRRITAAVVEPGGTPHDRTAIPQETCALIACESSDEAHYLCATLNSGTINRLAAAHGISGGKGFGSPGMIKHLPLERFDASDRRHVELASLSRQAHESIAADRLDPLTELQGRIDAICRYVRH